MSLEVSARFADRGLALDLTVGDGQVLAVLGPNGAGKSTLLGLVSGLLRPSAGRIVLDGRVLADERSFVPPHARGVGLLAQQALLFPHLSVEANVAFGPRSAGIRDARGVAMRWLEEVGMADFARRRPHELSGGQAQRVAIARALAAEPRLLLLDEPMAALDVTAAPEVRQVLRRVLRERSAILVTHDPLDALALADQVVVLEAGRIAERGPVQEVLAAPRSTFGAQLAGLVLIPGEIVDGGLRASDGSLVSGLVQAPGERGVALFSPSAVAVHAHDPGGSPRNRWAATVLDVTPRGELVRVRARAFPGQDVLADITVAAAAELDLAPGADVHLVVKATAVRVHPVG